MSPSLRLPLLLACLLTCLLAVSPANAEEKRLPATAYRIPKETVSEESGYFSIIEGKNGRLYIGTANYGSNGYLVEFDPAAKKMAIVVDAMKEIGKPATGFAAQAKIHTRNNTGESGKIYFGTKQGYPQKGEERSAYLGGYPMVYDPETGKTKVYEIPIPGQGIISVMPDESRNVAYVSTCSDERPIESTHFMVLDLATGKYRDLLDCRHMYSFIVVDHLHRAYHPILGGEIARFDPVADKLLTMKQTIDGKPPTRESLLADPQSHPINWDTTPDRKTLYCVAMSGNQLFSYDLTAEGDTLKGKSLGALLPQATKTDCRAMCVGPTGQVWAAVWGEVPGGPNALHLVTFKPGDPAPRDLGAISVKNADYTPWTDAEGKAFPWHHGMKKQPDGTLAPQYHMGVCEARDGRVYVTTIYPYTLLEIELPQGEKPGNNADDKTGEASSLSPPGEPKKIAALVTAYYHNSHADVIVSRLLETDTLDGQGKTYNLKLVSLYTDQVPANDKSRKLCAKHGIKIYDNPADALTLGTGKLAVDGVLLVAEHGNYPLSETGQHQYPKRRLFAEIAKACEASGRSVPVFIDKHLSDNWTDARWIYDEAARLKMPLMAGSSLPTLWRFPPVDVARGEALKEIVAISHHTLDTYGFHALEMVQCLAERRAGNESGIKAVQCLSGPAVWQAGEKGLYDKELLAAALSRIRRPFPQGKTTLELCKKPELFVIEYEDGLKASVLTLDGAVIEWGVAWRYRAADRPLESTLFSTQEARPFMHFGILCRGIEQMVHSHQSTWPVERTLLTSGALHALLRSKKAGGVRLETPELKLPYKSAFNWKEPPPAPPDRPIPAE